MKKILLALLMGHVFLVFDACAMQEIIVSAPECKVDNVIVYQYEDIDGLAGKIIFQSKPLSIRMRGQKDPITSINPGETRFIGHDFGKPGKYITKLSYTYLTERPRGGLVDGYEVIKMKKFIMIQSKQRVVQLECSGGNREIAPWGKTKKAFSFHIS